MADEARLQVSLQVVNGNLNYQSRPTAFTADMSTAKAPTPGRVLAAVLGTDVDLSQITTPGLAWLMNLDPTNFVEYGLWDESTNVFYVIGELLPGECFTLRLSRHMLVSYQGSSTVAGVDWVRLRLKADTAACECWVDVFEK